MACFVTLGFQKSKELDDTIIITYCTPECNNVLICHSNDEDSLFIKWLRSLYEQYEDIRFRYTGIKSIFVVKVLLSFCSRRNLECQYIDKSKIHVIDCDAVREGRWIHRSSWLERKYGTTIKDKRCITVVFMYYWLIESVMSTIVYTMELF